MQDVITSGTGRRALSLKRADLAGKTGTTNDRKDAWFAGFNSDLATVTWVGYDQPKSLYEYGAQAALPMWIDFMRDALKGKPEHSMPEPPDLITMRINPNTGYPAYAGETNAIFETFRTEDAPTAQQMNTNWDNPDQNQGYYQNDNSSSDDDRGGFFHIF